MQRFPVVRSDPLRAWDAADEYLLQMLDENEFMLTANTRMLLLNDQFGALAVNLHGTEVYCWSDSFLSHLATRHNYKLNVLRSLPALIPSTEKPTGVFDFVLIKIPKTLAMLEDQLIRLIPHITDQTRVVGAGMARHIHRSTLALFENLIGPTKTSLAYKKARLIHSQPEHFEILASPYPSRFTVPEWNLQLSNHANVFAREKLDIGARFMMQQLKYMPAAEHIIDLGCGNGVLGIIARRIQPDAKITFLDESYMAVDSARTNYEFAFGNTSDAEFQVSDIFSNSGTDDADLILCNPPFHQQHSIGDQLAWNMFKQSRRHLRKGGELWIVGNRHLNYHNKLKRLFGNFRAVAGSKKFVVLAACK